MIKKVLVAVPLALAMLIVSIAIGLGVIHLTNFIYYIDIEALDIPAESGYERGEILDNYHAVMDYLSPFNDDEFRLPTMEYSDSGAFHFEECKVIFNAIYFMGACGFVFLALMMCFYRDKLTYRISGIMTLCLPLTVVLAMAVNFEASFVLFHKLLFNNMDWIFDPRFDEIIRILPADFFMHCGIFIACCVLVGASIFIFKGFRSVGRRVRK